MPKLAKKQTYKDNLIYKLGALVDTNGDFLLGTIILL